MSADPVKEAVDRVNELADRFDRHEIIGRTVYAIECARRMRIVTSALSTANAEVKRLSVADKKWHEEFWAVEGERRAVCMVVEHHQNSGTPVSIIVKQHLAEANARAAAAEERETTLLAERDAAREQERALRAALSGLDASLRYDENDANADPDTFGDVHASVNVTVLRAQIASALTPENSHEA